VRLTKGAEYLLCKGILWVLNETICLPVQARNYSLMIVSMI